MLLFVSPHLRARELASSREQICKLPSPTQSSHPHPAPQHCRTANCRRRDLPYRVAYRGTFSRIERSSHVPPTHPRSDYQSLRWPRSFTERVYECSKKRNSCTAVHINCCDIPRVLGTHWAHTLGHHELSNSQLALRRGGSRTCLLYTSPSPRDS